jgi:hypothetical protein
MRNSGLSVLMILALAGSLTQSAGAQTASPANNEQQAYETFNGPWIDPQRWLALANTDPCRDSTNVMECVREIQGGKLRLLVKSYGREDSTSGSQWGDSTLISATHAQRSFTADVLVKSVSAVDCPSGGSSLAQAQFMVPFFNTGTTGDPKDTVQAYFVVQRAQGQPRVLYAYAIFEDHGVWSASSDAMAVSAGTPMRGTLIWDQPHQKFTATISNLLTHEQLTSDLPYSESVTVAPPMWALPVLQVVAAPANCSAVNTSASVEATFDNVMIDR